MGESAAGLVDAGAGGEDAGFGLGGVDAGEKLSGFNGFTFADFEVSDASADSGGEVDGVFGGDGADGFNGLDDWLFLCGCDFDGCSSAPACSGFGFLFSFGFGDVFESGGNEEPDDENRNENKNPFAGSHELFGLYAFERELLTKFSLFESEPYFMLSEVVFDFLESWSGLEGAVAGSAD